MKNSIYYTCETHYTYIYIVQKRAKLFELIKIITIDLSCSRQDYRFQHIHFEIKDYHLINDVKFLITFLNNVL